MVGKFLLILRPNAEMRPDASGAASAAVMPHEPEFANLKT